MSVKSFNYDNIVTFCERYGCKLLTPENELNAQTKIFQIKTRCGCITNTSFNQFVKYKQNIYCSEHLQHYLINGINCIRCLSLFTPTLKSYLFCSTKCVQSRDRPTEVKNKIKNSVLAYNKKNRENNSNETLKKKRKYVSDECNESNTLDTLNKEITPKRKVFKNIVSYETIKNAYETNNCVLVTTLEEYTELRNNNSLKKIQFKIISSCGHPTNDSLYYSFIEQNTGKLCRKCTDENTSKLLRDNSKIDGFNSSMIKQKIGIDIISDLCKNEFEIKKTRDGCKSNLLLRPIILSNTSSENENNNVNKWLQIKLKTKHTESLSDQSNSKTKTGFRINIIYPNVITIMLYTDINKIWLFEPEQLELKTYYAMDKEKNKYSNFLIENNLLVLKLKELFDKNIYNDTFDSANEPISSTVKLEYLYVLKRRNTINFIEFIENDVTSLVYNFKIGELKVQEKVFSPQKKVIYATTVCKNHGRRVKGPYEEGDNDIYWFNVNDGQYDFYVVPEYEMIRIECVSTKDTIGSSYFGIKNNSSWLSDYKFNYNTINEPTEKIKLLLLINTINEKRRIQNNTIQCT